MRLAVATIAAAAAPMGAGCAHRAELPPLALTVSGGAAGCRFEAEGRTVAEGRSAETRLAKAARAWRGRHVTVLGGMEAPFKCLGLAMLVLQREIGGGKIGFVAEPPE